jgi:hypothetical protein
MRSIFIGCISIFVLSAFVSCKQANTKDQETESEENYSDISNQNEEILNEVYSRFPSPEEMLSLINKNSTVFDKRILHKPDKVNEYLDSRSQALNLGIFSADLAFISLMEQHKESYHYFEAIFKLADNLRISSAFESSLIERTQNNITNPDSLRVLTDYAFNKISDYLVSNNKEKTFAIISIGGFVEALYLSFAITDEYSESNPLVQRIADQKLVLENLVDYCSMFPDDESVKSSVELLRPLISIYNEATTSKSASKMTRTADGRMVLKGGNKLAMTQEQFERLKDAVQRTRKSITH